jgi:hypothetical protein
LQSVKRNISANKKKDRGITENTRQQALRAMDSFRERKKQQHSVPDYDAPGVAHRSSSALRRTPSLARSLLLLLLLLLLLEWRRYVRVHSPARSASVSSGLTAVVTGRAAQHGSTSLPIKTSVSFHVIAVFHR